MPASRTRLSAAQARRVALGAQGFADPRPTGRIDRRHLRRVLDRMGLIQIDAVNVLVRSQELPLFSRLGPHPRSLIWDATRDGELFEYWVHEACHVPVEHYPLHRWAMDAHPRWERLRAWASDRADFVADVLDHVRNHGPIVASDLEMRDRPKEPWWDWDDGKRALEHLFRVGEVTATRRESDFARLYHAVEHVIPDALRHGPRLDVDESKKELLVLAAKHHGVGTAADLADYHRLTHTRPLFAELVEEGRLVPVEVEGWGKPAYMHPDATIPRRIGARALLSPFDPVVWFRERAERLFGFHYRIEIYVPKPKRRFGYYVLPFLLGDDLVGRVDLKADRAAGELLVQAAWAEPGVPRDLVAGELAEELRSMAAWLDLDDVRLNGGGDLRPALATALG
ncbi:MAG: crosslink repair DNA glycosylase YcaQ family protein [Ilumatobacter sp.]|uniref:winged helix-turn-helix domain-containing protein n=1 Tax=Ilumatobacter sp. TaxID=1967498 RepID=UPI0026391CF0|nr:crosslink repair DNA glycosylase YcaQ family protein [Ilumatobacter sp.]MDJ0767986.1 crosslink repair DNA glycosylase YcaQ family protein [Ilumatobacter sp.]